MSHIASAYPSNVVRVHQEPVANWMNVQGFDLLQALYTESERWTFAFEMSALLSRIRNHTNALQNAINVYERSILSSFHVFIQNELAENYLNQAEYRILQDHFEYGLKKTIDLSNTIILYFDLPPEECLKRIVERSRSSETNLDLHRLEQLKSYYDRFVDHFSQCPIIRINAGKSKEEICQQIDTILQQYLHDNQAIE